MKTLSKLTLCLATLTLTTPAMAYNDWYNQGYADGAVSTELACKQTKSSNMSLYQENQQLRQRIAELEASSFSEVQDVAQSGYTDDNPLRRNINNNRF